MKVRAYSQAFWPEASRRYLKIFLEKKGEELVWRSKHQPWWCLPYVIEVYLFYTRTNAILLYRIWRMKHSNYSNVFFFFLPPHSLSSFLFSPLRYNGLMSLLRKRSVRMCCYMLGEAHELYRGYFEVHVFSSIPRNVFFSMASK